MAQCNVCFRHCDITEGHTGACRARTCRNGVVVPSNYGRVTSIALDSIEKKPLARFCPGSKILSAGSYGCNLFCPFCQNYDISRSDGKLFDDEIAPEQLAELALRYVDRGNIGIAYTYNEPTVGYEFVRDTARIVNSNGLKNVLVTNGSASREVLEDLIPYIDAMNIDIKSMSDKTYRDILGGDLNSVKDFITGSYRRCHVELTMLIVPGMNDSEDELRELSAWIAGLDDNIPLHVTRFYPRYKMTDRGPTEVERVYRLADIAREKLRFVYTGNC
ncbi:MAG: AmmeMemoRadiSam system radical SAM enzyme [Clostridiales bacterium]|nr:AmmeMemoRadiSam system radical SAM enzyme [Clostridiales bacterium]